MDNNSLEDKKYAAAKAYAAAMHEGQLRAGGEPYITHPVAVAEYLKNKGYGIDYLITALFHDLLEDTAATEGEIEKLGGKEVLSAVKLLTKIKGQSEEEYVRGIKENPVAVVVKGADRLHNLKSAVCRDEAFRRKYVEESKKYYSDLNSEIPAEIENLEKTFL